MGTYLEMCWLLDELLILLQYPLQLGVLLHQSLVLVRCPLLLGLLPLGCRRLQLLQTSRLEWVPGVDDVVSLRVNSTGTYNECMF